MGATVRQFIEEQADGEAWCWPMLWLPSDPKSVVVQADGWDRPREVHCLDAPVPEKVHTIGWTGLCKSGVADWIGFDLDVGHGPECYDTLEDATSAAYTLRGALKGNAEIRLSKSGNGVHVRHGCHSAKLSNEEAVAFAKALVKKLGIRACPTPLGRQCFFFWTREPKPDSFRLIAEDAGRERALKGDTRDAT